MINIPIFHILAYSFTLWFGLYIIARDKSKLGLRYAGLGLISYAFALAATLIVQDSSQTIAWSYLPIMLPSVFWMSATFYLIPDVPVERVNQHILVLMLIIILITFIAAIIQPQIARWVGLSLPIIFLLGSLLRLRQAFQSDLPRPPLVVLMTATVFFALATGLIALPIQWIAQDWVIFAVSLDLIFLGYTLAVLDAYDEGTNLFADASRSLLAAMLSTLIFGGQIVMVMAITNDTSSPMLILLFGVITTLLILLVFYDDIQLLLDSIVFAQAPQKRTQRAHLRAASSALVRSDDSRMINQIEDKEFVRLTRRALSNYGDLNKLASSPLLQLPLLDNEDEDNVLSRANALKSLLRESIEQLKPSGDIPFASTNEWRYYNVLYFPYIAGLKPYSQRFFRDDLDPAEKEALDWFRTYVPERTLYNWQKTAAELVAQNLRDKLAESQ